MHVPSVCMLHQAEEIYSFILRIWIGNVLLQHAGYELEATVLL